MAASSTTRPTSASTRVRSRSRSRSCSPTSARSAASSRFRDEAARRRADHRHRARCDRDRARRAHRHARRAGPSAHRRSHGARPGLARRARRRGLGHRSPARRLETPRSTISAKPGRSRCPPLPVDGGEVRGALEDMQGRFNLNNLVTDDRSANETAVAQFERLLLLVGAQPRWARIMADWIDDGTVPENPEGAEDGTYLSQNPPYRAANGIVTTTTEMMALPGMTREEFERIRPYVAALPVGDADQPLHGEGARCSRRSSRAARISAMRSCSRRTAGTAVTLRKDFLQPDRSTRPAGRHIQRVSFRNYRLVPRCDGRAYWHLGIHAVQSDRAERRTPASGPSCARPAPSKRMNQFLVLRLANPISWVITGADGGRLGPVSTGDLADAAPVAAERQVVVIAPGLERHARAPGTSGQGRRKARPGRALRDGRIACRRSRAVSLRDRRDRRRRQHAGRRAQARRTARLARCARGRRHRAAVHRAGHALHPREPGEDRRRHRRRATPGARAGEPACRPRCRAADGVLHARGTRGRRSTRAALRVAARLAALARNDRGVARSDGQPRSPDTAGRRASAPGRRQPCAPTRSR